MNEGTKQGHTPKKALHVFSFYRYWLLQRENGFK